MPSAYFSLSSTPSLADDLVVDAGLLHLEAGGVDQHVERVVSAVEDRALRADLGDALAVGVDEMDVRPVERRQVVVVEARPLAHEHVPGLQRLGGRLVLDDLVDAPVDAHHVVDVGVLLAADLLLARRARPARSSALGQLRGSRMCFTRRACLPARLQRRRPLRIGRPVVADVDRRRRALEDVELLGRLAPRRGIVCTAEAPVPMMPTTLSGRFSRSCAGVVVVPARGVEGMALEASPCRRSSTASAWTSVPLAQMTNGPSCVSPRSVPRCQSLVVVVPDRGGDRGLEHGQVVEVVACGRSPGSGRRSPGPWRSSRDGHVAHLVEQRQVVVGDGTSQAAPGIAVPVPGAADVGAALDDADALDAALAQARRRSAARRSRRR